MNKIRFTKMHGAGNDFILVDDRAGTFPAALSSSFANPSAKRSAA